MTFFQYDIPELKELALKWIRSTIHSCDIIQELASDFTAMYRFPSSLVSPSLLSNEIRFPEIREICLQQLANALCASDRVNTSKNLMSAIQGCIHGNSGSIIDPETRGAIFDMLNKGYTPTNRLPYATPVSNMACFAQSWSANPPRFRCRTDLLTGCIFGRHY